MISTAGDATLSVADPSSTATGHLVNGAFSLPQPLQAKARTPPTRAASPRRLLGRAAEAADLGGSGLQRRRDAGLRQRIDASDALRTGAYAQDAHVHALHDHAVAAGRRDRRRRSLSGLRRRRRVRSLAAARAGRGPGRRAARARRAVLGRRAVPLRARHRGVPDRGRRGRRRSRAASCPRARRSPRSTMIRACRACRPSAASELHADVATGAKYRLVLDGGRAGAVLLQGRAGDRGARVRRGCSRCSPRCCSPAAAAPAVARRRQATTLPGPLPSGVTFAAATSSAAAPPFSLKLLDGTPRGRGQALDATARSSLFFFASWCSRCADQQAQAGAARQALPRRRDVRRRRRAGQGPGGAAPGSTRTT